jgi:hypothetical protein
MLAALPSFLTAHAWIFPGNLQAVLPVLMTPNKLFVLLMPGESTANAYILIRSALHSRIVFLANAI